MQCFLWPPDIYRHGTIDDSMRNKHPLTWIAPGEEFPSVEAAWPAGSGAPGLLAAGGDLTVPSLVRAYSNGIFPWFSEGDPLLWWSTDPRMVLEVAQFRLHRSLRKTLQKFQSDAHCEIRVDSAFAQVIAACAGSPRNGQAGTWIVPAMVDAYTDFHRAGYAHSIETWINGTLVGGLYCVSIGRAVFGESMFAHVTDASKIALAALVAICRNQGIAMVDCQQNTNHLASLGAQEISRTEFLQRTQAAIAKKPADWQFSRLYWNAILDTCRV
jgi:leucyl/phenylalanyl-tRNA---protein transferase